jgi:hypothetical protein
VGELERGMSGMSVLRDERDRGAKGGELTTVQWTHTKGLRDVVAVLLSCGTQWVEVPPQVPLRPTKPVS